MPQMPALVPSVGLPVFSFPVVCPMCGQSGGAAPTAAHSTVKWCPGVDCPQVWARLRVPNCLMEGEHIHRSCPVCGYEFLQLSLA